MPPDDKFLLAIIAAVFLTSAIAAFAFAKVVLVRERTGGTDGRINTAAESGQAAKTSERRRSERILRRIGVFAYSHAPGQNPFHEEATTLEVSSHGGLLLLTENVFVGQKLLLMNTASQDERECHVVRFTHKPPQKREVAVEFMRSAPDFWQTHAENPTHALQSD